MLPSNLPNNAPSLDWILLAQRDHMVIAQCKGLRNIPSRSVECDIVRKINYHPVFGENVGLNKLVFAMCDKASDEVEVYGSDTIGNMLKLKCDAS